VDEVPLPARDAGSESAGAKLTLEVYALGQAKKIAFDLDDPIE
jgi:hypothetical protein